MASLKQGAAERPRVGGLSADFADGLGFDIRSPEGELIQVRFVRTRPEHPRRFSHRRIHVIAPKRYLIERLRKQKADADTPPARNAG